MPHCRRYPSGSPAVVVATRGGKRDLAQFMVHDDARGTGPARLGPLLAQLDNRGRGFALWPSGFPRLLLRASGLESVPDAGASVGDLSHGATIGQRQAGSRGLAPSGAGAGVPAAALRDATVAEAGAGAAWKWPWERRGRPHPLAEPLRIQLGPRVALQVRGLGDVSLSVSGHSTELACCAASLASLAAAAASAAADSSGCGRHAPSGPGGGAGGAPAQPPAAAEVIAASLAATRANGWQLPTLSASGRETKAVADAVAAESGAVRGLGTAVRLAEAAAAAALGPNLRSSLTRSMAEASSAGGAGALSKSGRRALPTVARHKAAASPDSQARHPRRREPAALLPLRPLTDLPPLREDCERRGSAAVLVALLVDTRGSGWRQSARAAAAFAATMERVKALAAAPARLAAALAPLREQANLKSSAGAGDRFEASGTARAVAAASDPQFDCAACLLAAAGVEAANVVVAMVDSSPRGGPRALRDQFGATTGPQWLVFAGGARCFAGACPGQQVLARHSRGGAPLGGKRGLSRSQAADVSACMVVAALRSGAGSTVTPASLAVQVVACTAGGLP